ncbi:nucleotidyltransferase [Terasakiella brassicae]|uniref:Nucleotidyltransferase n=1 Tax=Terasakiella brassicae TaxID=1634917 RepID=A0A917C102_9PROT|nr:nucleotidyltransferase family protein [Terasakiella brassicae]GGF67164.1 nucleotidyltransferase [Terasakiella brassicae]
MSETDAIFEKLNTLQDELKPFCIARIGVFGSFARGTPRSDSDIDMLIEFAETPGLLQLAELRLKLEEIFGRRVDIATREMLASDMKDNVLSEVIYDETSTK